MTITPELRAAVRSHFQGCCGYCGVSEHDVGNELDIDHFRPRVQHGGNEPDNLIYACPACNRFKGAYWPGDDAPDELRLLNPNRDPLDAHIAETVSGRMVGLTPRGWFHIGWLHLNRPLLVTMRLQRQRRTAITDALSQAQITAAQLQAHVTGLEQELAELRAIVQRLTGMKAGGDS